MFYANRVKMLNACIDLDVITTTHLHPGCWAGHRIYHFFPTRTSSFFLRSRHRIFSRTSSKAVLADVFQLPHKPAMAASSKQSIVYKVVDGLEITLDIYIPASAQAVPILLWFHGGGLLQGHRQGVAPHMLESVSKHNHALISADYRLAPQVGVQKILKDVQDCVTFIRQSDGLASHLEGNNTVDTSRLAISGSSAGGYLALLAGLYVEPKPQVILPIYPITDPLGIFFTTSQPGPSEVASKKLEVDAAVQPFLERDAAAVANNAPGTSRGQMYSYMLSNANLAELLHFDTDSHPQHNPSNDKWRIPKQIATRRLPPTYIVHGAADHAVGVEQADEVVGVMVGQGLEVKYERLGGKDHLFDVNPSETLQAMYEFMHKYV
jgi:acetyl esterase/lipase